MNVVVQLGSCNFNRLRGQSQGHLVHASRRACLISCIYASARQQASEPFVFFPLWYQDQSLAPLKCHRPNSKCYNRLSVGLQDHQKQARAVAHPLHPNAAHTHPAYFGRQGRRLQNGFHLTYSRTAGVKYPYAACTRTSSSSRQASAVFARALHPLPLQRQRAKLLFAR